MPSRKLTDLHPLVQPLAKLFLEKCDKAGIDILITCTYRSNKEQEECYAQGRTTPGKIVTNARAGQSKHNYMINGVPASKAFDVVPLRFGKLVWGTRGNGIDNDPTDDDKDDLELWQRVGQIGKACGLEWAGDWTRFKEFPHFQLRD
jgi:peptidoglycan L-alanyl-D-glutamate endopeptidase CwlK